MTKGEGQEGAERVDPATEVVALRRQLAAAEERLKHELAEKSAEIEQARAAAELASRAKTAFLANMSHEIRTPLSAVMGYANLIAATERSSPETREWSKRLQRSAEHLLALLDDVLDLAKIEAGKLDLHFVSVDPSAILEEVGVLMEPRAIDKGLELTVVADTELPARLRTDPLRLKQILANLVGNAIKYTPRGEVAVHARLRMSPVGRTFERRLEIEVVDTGVGIPDDELERLFLPFEQGRSRPRSGGVGLGLDISRRLVRLLGGDITAASEVGVGSNFTVVLPVDGGAGTTPARLVTRSGLLTAAPIVPRLDGRRVLVVDDAEDNRTILAHFLEQAGAEVTTATTLAEAESILAGPLSVQVIVTDLQLADGDGLTLVRRMAERGDHRPVLALTADAMLDTRERAMAAGVADFMVKPVVAWRLVSRVLALPLDPTHEPPRLVPVSTVSVRNDGGEASPSRPASRPALKRIPTTPTGMPIPPSEPERRVPTWPPVSLADVGRDPQRTPTAPSPRPVAVEVTGRSDPDTARERRPQVELAGEAKPSQRVELDRPDVPDELIERFYALLDERAYALEEGLLARDAARLRDIGHRIAGSGATMGHPELTDHGRNLERVVASGAAWDQVETTARELMRLTREASERRRWAPPAT